MAKRGIKDILIMCANGLKGLKEAYGHLQKFKKGGKLQLAIIRSEKIKNIEGNF